SLTGAHPSAPAAEPMPAALDAALADVLHLPAPASSSKAQLRRRPDAREG
ncbi:MAG: hypothetical protein QOG56_891, partial [Solirubrobacteraceae bacterium]|nr:hypothetical protein [Solirubrobacteraceae bacterium]